MFSHVVMGVDSEHFENALTKLKVAKGVKLDVELSADDMKELVRQFKEINPNLPTDAYLQLEMAIKAVFQSWHNPRAVRYRAYNGISASSGTAVNIQSMVFGNKNDNCGTGVGFTRNPANGENTFYGEYLVNAQGEDVVAGIRTPQSVIKMKEHWPIIYDELVQIRDLLEKEYHDMQDIEFTIEDGKLFMLQTRGGKRTAKASVTIAVDMVKEGMLTEKEALLQIKAERMDFFLFPSIDPNSPKNVIAKGLPASPGTRTGMIVFNPDDAERTAAEGVAVILVRRDTTPEDIHGMKAAEGILTQLGGMTSHAAVVARGMGTTCVAGCSDIKVDVENEIMTYANGQKTLKRGNIITLDGTAGEVILGKVVLAEAGSDEDFQTVLSWADKYRKLKVMTNADTPTDASTARRLGAEGIGLCRTEHMFFDPERINVMRKMVLADTVKKRKEQLDQLFFFQKEDMLGIFKSMDGLPVTIRLLDPPLHEFLPHDDHACELLGNLVEVKKRCEELKEVNPMLGFRGCRLSVIYPEITVMQVKAIMTAACEAAKNGGKPIVEIMIPVVSMSSEIDYILPLVKKTANEVLAGQGLAIPYKVGSMIELPRACIVADDIVKAGVEFFSFGSNDLTQTVYGFSRDDMREFIPSYISEGVLEVDPFVTIDKDGVGTFMKMTLEKALPVNPDLSIGICGEHGGDPTSIQFFHDIGLDYVSCSPFRVPIARIAAGQAAIKDSVKKD
jgi:pyruvate,orthophosphate dikinase